MDKLIKAIRMLVDLTLVVVVALVLAILVMAMIGALQ